MLTRWISFSPQFPFHREPHKFQNQRRRRSNINIRQSHLRKNRLRRIRRAPHHIITRPHDLVKTHHRHPRKPLGKIKQRRRHLRNRIDPFPPNPLKLLLRPRHHPPVPCRMLRIGRPPPIHIRLSQLSPLPHQIRQSRRPVHRSRRSLIALRLTPLPLTKLIRLPLWRTTFIKRWIRQSQRLRNHHQIPNPQILPQRNRLRHTQNPLHRHLLPPLSQRKPSKHMRVLRRQIKKIKHPPINLKSPAQSKRRTHRFKLPHLRRPKIPCNQTPPDPPPHRIPKPRHFRHHSRHHTLKQPPAVNHHNRLSLCPVTHHQNPSTASKKSANKKEPGQSCPGSLVLKCDNRLKR